MSEETTTLLSLSIGGVHAYSARGLTQTLEHIDAAVNNRRTVNGNLLDVSASQFRKYKSQITCNDQKAPALDGIWPGMQVVVDCVAELSYKTAGGSPARTVVSGSSYTEGDFTFYRPQLTMRVAAFTESLDEYGAQVAWSLSLEEV